MSTGSSLIIRATFASIITACMILLAKIAAWYETDSPAVLGTMLDSFLDIAASCINFSAAKYALQPPDEEHPFGHGKAEDLAVFTQSSFFGMSGVFIIIVAIKKILHPVSLQGVDFGIAVMAFSIVVTTLLLIYQTYVYKSTGSTIVKADRFHYSIDLITNIVVIASLYLADFFDSKFIDPFFAILIAVYILYGAAQLFIRAFNNLLDHEFNDDDKKKLHEIILSHNAIKGYHAVKTRYAGRQHFIQFHLELDGKMSLNQAHKIADEIEEKILLKFKDAQVIIHQDPARLNDTRKISK